VREMRYDLYILGKYGCVVRMKQMIHYNKDRYGSYLEQVPVQGRLLVSSGVG